LPKIYAFTTNEEKLKFLQAYTQVYLKEEIWIEPFIHKLDPFRKFLEVCAQCNGKIINVAGLANDVGVDAKTINAYFSILEDTLMVFF
jgi:predicted AAA+ superfamily ATPase